MYRNIQNQTQPLLDRSVEETTSPDPGGSCFSLLFYPPLLIFLIVSLLVIFSGETSDPLSLGKNRNQTTNLISAATKKLSPVFTPEIFYWSKQIINWAEDWNLDPNLVATVMQIESCGDPGAQSGSGAIGLFQVMPYHFDESDSPFLPQTNAKRGLSYLRQALDQYDTPRLAFAGYNGGISTAGKAQSLWPAETIRYTYWGINIYQDAAAGKNHSPTLDEWLAAGGSSLCAQASERLGFSP